jgi:hypothetical protein
LRKDRDVEVNDPISVEVACFDAAGEAIASWHGSFTTADSIAPNGGTSSFSIDLGDIDSCENHAVGASIRSWSEHGTTPVDVLFHAPRPSPR